MAFHLVWGTAGLRIQMSDRLPGKPSEPAHITDMNKDPRGTNNPSQRSTQRWENEGGAIRGVRTGRSQDRTTQDKAAHVAAEVIDQHADHSATFEIRERRKRRLLKGPKEFRDMRRDQPNKDVKPRR